MAELAPADLDPRAPRRERRRIAAAGHPSPRIVRTRRGGSVSGVCAASSSTASAKRSSSSSEREEADADPQRVERVDRPGDREDPRPELVERGLRRPAGDPERHQGRHRVRRGQDGHAGDRGQTRRRRGRHRGPAPVDEVEPDVHRQPADRAGHADDRRAVEAAAPRTAARRATRRRRRSGRAARSRTSRRAPGRGRRSRAGSTTSAPIPSGPSSHFWAGMA